MAGKPKKILDPKPTVSASDPTKFRPEVFDLIRTKVAPMIGGNINLGVKMTAEFFKAGGLMPRSVSVDDLTDDMVAKIVSKLKVAERGDRLPLDEGAQENWNIGRWKGQLTMGGLRQRYGAELKDGQELSTEMLDAYGAELKAEQAKIDALVNECDDPDAPIDRKFPCGNPSHRGKNEPFTLQVRYLLVRNDSGNLERRRHAKGDGGEILAGDLLVVTASEAKESDIQLTEAELAEGGKRIPFCKNCKMAALDEARNDNLKITFYTWVGADIKLAAASKTAESQEKTSGLLRAVGQRRGSYGSGSNKVFKQSGWRRS